MGKEAGHWLWPHPTTGEDIPYLYLRLTSGDLASGGLVARDLGVLKELYRQPVEVMGVRWTRGQLAVGWRQASAEFFGGPEGVRLFFRYSWVEGDLGWEEEGWGLEVSGGGDGRWTDPVYLTPQGALLGQLEELPQRLDYTTKALIGLRSLVRRGP